MFAVSLFSGFAIRWILQLVGRGAPTPFTQVLGGLMVGFAGIILYGYWAEYRAALARGAAASRPGTGVGCLLIVGFVSCFVIGLVVLAWKMFQP